MLRVCELCNGTHVVKTMNGAIFGFYTCPNCGPMSDEQFQQRRAEMRAKIEAAKLELIKGA